MPPLSPIGHSLLDRRFFLAGTGGLALTTLLAQDRLLGEPLRPVIRPEAPLAARPAHFAPRANRVVVLFCSGACSHLDTWDYKPELERRHGQPMPGADKLVTFQGGQGNLTRSPFTFRPRGQCGKYVSDLVPHLGALADEVCFVHSLTTKTNTHGPGENVMNTGFTLDGFPSLGAWVSYALGTESADLPAFVAIPDPRGVPQTGTRAWGSGFLSAVFQGVPMTADKPIPHLQRPPGLTADADQASRDLLRLLNDRHLERHPQDAELAARIASYELAGRMQLRAADLGDFRGESPAIRKLYCLDDSNPTKAAFGRNCLLACRLLERGVRCVTLFNGAFAMGEGVGNWDGHKTLAQQYRVHGPILDEPAAGLLRDLRGRGLLDDTLFVWTTEFGRMPTFQAGASGRDHNPHGFTAWLAGAGLKAPFSFGATDEFGHKAVENVVTVHDFHATILHLLGLDHERLSFYHNGIERRLTDVHGKVIRDVLA
jgi:hypothetical protein